MNVGEGNGVAGFDATGVAAVEVKDARESNEEVDAGRDEVGRGDAPARLITPTPPTPPTLPPPGMLVARFGDESK